MPAVRTIQASLKSDPTRTLSIRRQFEADMVRRFTKIKRAIIDAVVTKDVFGLVKRVPFVNAELTPSQFQFSTDATKIDGFMSWLKEMEEKNILTTEMRPGLYQGDKPWTNMYIQSAYQRGMSRARSELRKAGYDVPSATGVDFTGKSSVAVAFNQPFSADRVAVIYTRAYNELKGVTAAMDQQISRVLAQGLTEGRNPMEIARMLVDRVDKIGITRARTLARTEVINAHHQATINEYEQWGVLGVAVEAEWLTAGFHVCPECASNEGKIFTLAQIRGMIPLHPNCRCCALPVSKKKQAEMQKAKSGRPSTEAPRRTVTSKELDEIFENGGFDEVKASKKKEVLCKRIYEEMKDDPDFNAYMNRYMEDSRGATYWKELPMEDKIVDLNRTSLDRISEWIQNWAMTSGDSNPRVIAMQKAAMEEFGLTDATTMHFPPKILKFVSGESIDLVAEQSVNIPVYRKFLRVQYNLTQEVLANNSIAEIELLRGMSYPEPTLKISGQHTIKLQPMSSFSSDKGSARYFANEMSQFQEVERVLITTRVPAKNILSTTRTGFGCTCESEFVVLGGEMTGNIEVSAIRFE